MQGIVTRTTTRNTSLSNDMGARIHFDLSALRVGLGRYNGEAEVDEAMDELSRTVQDVRGRAISLRE
jgi:cysteine sulfinate desulfinase/cysteine desulfurase-like protein